MGIGKKSIFLICILLAACVGTDIPSGSMGGAAAPGLQEETVILEVDIQFPILDPMIVGNIITKDSQAVLEAQVWVWDDSLKHRVESPSGGTLRIVNTQDQSIQDITLLDKTFDCDPEPDVTRTGFFTATLAVTQDQKFSYQFFLKRLDPPPSDAKIYQENGETFWLQEIILNPMIQAKQYDYNFCAGQFDEPHDFTLPVFDPNTPQKADPNPVKFFYQFKP